jgi:hypothetical protein
MLFPGLLVCHHPFGRGNNGNPKTIEHPGKLVGTDIIPQSRAAGPFQFLDGWLLGYRMVLEGYLDDALLIVILKFIIQDIPHLKKDLGNIFLDIRSRDLHNAVAGLEAIPDSGQII